MTASRVLVLGASGFAGRAIATRLASGGISVLAYGRSPPNGTNIEPIAGSIEDTTLLRETVKRCSHIVHAASVTTPGISARDPSLEITGNLLPLARLLECAEIHPDRRLVYLSSGGAIYGDLTGAARESDPLRPRSYYGASKAAAEAMIHAAVASTTWNACVLRPSNLYGPGQHTARGFAIVPTLFARALDGQPFHVWGDGSTVRDYCYIDDLVDAVRLASTIETPGSRFTLCNVASGETASILELVAACERVAGRHIPIRFQPARGVDVPRVTLDVSAIQALGWRARVGIEEGLHRTWAALTEQGRRSEDG